MNLCSDVLRILKGKTLVTAESCTGGGIGAAITAVPGSSAVYKGEIISYCNELKNSILRVDASSLEEYGAVSAPVAESMALGARMVLQADIAVSVTGLAGKMTYSQAGHAERSHFLPLKVESRCLSFIRLYLVWRTPGVASICFQTPSSFTWSQ